jgi:putative zinc finger protein/anti-sigma-K factor RskA
VRCAEVRSLLGGYVLQALEPADTDAVRAHLAGCADCAREWSQLGPLPELLDAVHDPDAAPEEPPASLEEAVLDRFARERPPARARGRERRRGARLLRPFARPLPAALAAAIAGAAIALAVNAGLDVGGSAPAKVYGAHLHGAAGPAGPKPYAYARLSSFDAGTRVKLRVSGLRPAPGVVYELWCVYPNGSKVSGGTFRVGSDGRAELSMTTAARVGDYNRLSVERRASGHRGEPVMAGDISY